MAQLCENVRRLREILRDCTLCPRNCHVNRLEGRIGACRIGAEPKVASAGPHFGEEPMLVGAGSGTIFLAGCNLACVFCQNWEISQLAQGQVVSTQDVAQTMLGLQARGCVNINFVSPTHVAHAVAEATYLARSQGLHIPTVYNCGGYDAVATLRLLEGLVDIYMPDFKYADAQAARTYSGVNDYPAVARAALEEMYHQVGPLRLDARGLATRGVLVRHLVMPGNLARSREVIDTVAAVAPGCTINVMAQYHPAHRARGCPELTPRVEGRVVQDLRSHAQRLGLRLAR